MSTVLLAEPERPDVLERSPASTVGRARRGRLRAGLAVGVALVGVLAVAAGVDDSQQSAARPAAVVVPSGCSAPRWVSAWQAATQPAPGDPALAGATLRMIVHPQVTGAQVRIRLSNAYGTAPLAVGTASAGRSDGAAGLLPGSMRPVTFAGSPEVVIPAGGSVVSDPAPLVAEVGRPIAVSFYLPAAPAVVTQHAIALQTSYLARSADAALATAGTAFDRPVGSWLVLDGLDVLAPRPENAVVAVGDSITDGFGTALDANARWSDALAARLAAAGGASDMAVLNAGISRNRLLADDPAGDGDAPLTRFDRDVAAAPGVTDVVLHIGTNDIAAGRPAGEIIAGLERYTERARAAGKRVFLTTITPSVAGPHGTPAALSTRAAVNAWVLGEGREHADGVFDFAAAVADPAQPARLAPAFDSGDGLHLSAAGYQALARAVDVARLSGSPCLADTSPARIVLSGS
ncbi:GDSL-type esterase/lipase family protein [Pseudonocardia sp. GCM10023141]|uniref:GDSL-type esterase/lipase family protein n=1 Tax=Pseudonocardia sp. GCM10023141 TaxID=3252653 RepID=UPI00360D33AF